MGFEVADIGANIRNVALVSHVGTGKTSLADAILFNSGHNTRLGKVDNGTSLLDFEPEEITRRTSISTAVASISWKDIKINLIDTPGGSNFVADTRNALQISDSAIFVFDSTDGIKIQSTKLIKLCEELNLPMAVFINKLERENSNYSAVLDGIKNAFSAKPVLMQLPLGEEAEFNGVIDLIRMRALVYGKDESGEYTEMDIPSEYQDKAEVVRETSIESIVECDDELLEKYLEGQDIADDEVLTVIRKGVLNNLIVPVFFGAATKNIGVNLLQDFIADYFPSPQERGEIKVLDKSENITSKIISASEPLVALVFKTVSDPFFGQMSIMRIFSGEMSSDSGVYNSNNQSKERIGQIVRLVGKKHEPVEKAVCGDIVAVLKLKDTHTGDTLCDEKSPVIIPPISQPAPVISFAIKPKSKGDEDKIQIGLKRLMEEDSTLLVSRDAQTRELILSGLGQVHLDIAIEKLKRKFGVEVVLETPKIPYKETIVGNAKVEGKYKKQSGGKGQYGDCWIELHPVKDKEFEFIDKIVGGAIPRQYIPAIETGIREAMQEGVLAGFPATGIQVTLFDGSFHPVDSSEMAFKVAGSMAFKKAALEAKPVILEPVMHVEITIPEENVGDIMGDLNSKRGRMLGIEGEDKTQTVKAEIPMAEMLSYAADLNSITRGAGFFTMEFARYDEIPPHLAQKIIEKSKAAREATTK